MREAAQYHVARLCAYVFLGATAGLVSAATLRPWIESLGVKLGFVLGLVMLVYALIELARAVWAGLHRQSYSSLVQSATRTSRTSPLFHMISRIPAPRSIGLGIATALLPCGFLYAALAQAALIAHPVWSGAAMLGFALATSPALTVGSGLVATIGRRFPRMTPPLFALLLVITSLSVLLRALNGAHHEHSQGSASHHQSEGR